MTTDDTLDLNTPLDAEALVAECAKLAAERDEWKDKAYRLAADADNAKRRATLDVADAKKFATQSFARDMLPIADNLVRALSAPEGNEKALRDGVAMVAAALEQTFTRHGIVRVKAEVGQPLNPDLHQAMTEVESNNPAGTIVSEMQSGFTLHDRLLRPAMVSVSRGESQ